MSAPNQDIGREAEALTPEIERLVSMSAEEALTALPGALDGVRAEGNVEDLEDIFTMDCGPGISLSAVIRDGMRPYYPDDPARLNSCVEWIKRQVCKNARTVLAPLNIGWNEAVAALAPFAAYGGLLPGVDDPGIDDEEPGFGRLTYGDFRKAMKVVRESLAPTQEPK